MDAMGSMSTAADLLRGGTARLSAAGIDTSRLDAEVLLALAMDTDRAGLYARLHQDSSAEVEQRFNGLVDRRARREPIAYITGEQEFWSLRFAVNPAVLIPRPETELLVQVVCRFAADSRAARGGAATRPAATPDPWTVCDVGTGSGCVAVALASELPDAHVVAVDVSPGALAVAARNAAAHGVADRLTFVHSDLFDAVGADARFDVIVSNPPYCRPDDPVSPELAFEPHRALAAGSDGLDIVRRLIAAAPARLRAGGWLAMELGRGQDAAVRALARATGLADIAIEPDLAGISRVLVAHRI